MRTLKVVAGMLALLTTAASPPAPVRFTDYAGEFDRFEAHTRDMPADARVAAFRQTFDKIRPGLYSDIDPQRLDRLILRSLEQFPALRPTYRSVEQGFGPALSEAVHHFRRQFPDFSPPLPIILAHELGVRDGGSDYVAGRKVMLFGADMIAKLHDDDSLQPFLEHELFHLEHARHFADCDQFWCPLWQEGLATYAASLMTPGATDHQLLLDWPKGIREPTSRHWNEALCLVAAQFDRTDETAITAAFSAGDSGSSDLPRRYGYYVGLMVAAEAGRQHSLPELARLSGEEARPVVAAALGEIIDRAGAPCSRPPATEAITHRAPRPA
jgi:hypothetical protein